MLIRLLKFCFSFPVFLERLHSPVHMPRNCLSFVVRKSIGMPWSLSKSLLASLCLLELLWLDPLENGNSFPLMDVNHTRKPGLHLSEAGQAPQPAPAPARPSKRTLQTKSRSAQHYLAHRKAVLACPWLMNMLIIVSASLFQGSSFPYPLCLPLMTYIRFVWIIQSPGKLILKDFQVHSAFPETASSAWKFCPHGKKGISLFQLSGTLTCKTSRNLQEMAFVCLHRMTLK